VGDAYFLAFHYYFRFAGTFLGGSSSGSPCTLSDPSCSFDINRSSALGIVSTGPLARFRGLPLVSRITIGYSPSFGASFALSVESRSHLIAAAVSESVAKGHSAVAVILSQWHARREGTFGKPIALAPASN
jgi:hypothetical protein